MAVQTCARARWRWGKSGFNEGTANWPCKRSRPGSICGAADGFNEGTANWPCKLAQRTRRYTWLSVASMRARPIGRANAGQPPRHARGIRASMRARPIGRANLHYLPRVDQGWHRFNEGTANWPCKRGRRGRGGRGGRRFNEGTANWPCKPIRAVLDGRVNGRLQ